MDKRPPEEQAPAPEKERDQEQSAQEQDVCAGTVTLTSDEFDQVRQHIEELKQQNDATVSLAQRVQADFENFRRRNACVRADSLEEGARDVIRDLLPVIDNFERAIASGASGANGDAQWREGVKLVYRQLLDSLTKHGLDVIPSEGQFDPELHEAVLQEEAEGMEPGTIVETLQKGYRVKERIIRYSMVKVAK